MPAQPPPEPASWSGSDLEWLVFWALTVPLDKQQDVDFAYQSSAFGGKRAFGGLVMDFLMLDGTNIAIDILGEYWHYGSSQLTVEAAIRKERLGHQGITLIFIDGADVKSDVVHYVTEALAGVDHSRMSRGV